MNIPKRILLCMLLFPASKVFAMGNPNYSHKASAPPLSIVIPSAPLLSPAPAHQPPPYDLENHQQSTPQIDPASIDGILAHIERVERSDNPDQLAWQMVRLDAQLAKPFRHYPHAAVVAGKIKAVEAFIYSGGYQGKDSNLAYPLDYALEGNNTAMISKLVQLKAYKSSLTENNLESSTTKYAYQRLPAVDTYIHYWDEMRKTFPTASNPALWTSINRNALQSPMTNDAITQAYIDHDHSIIPPHPHYTDVYIFCTLINSTTIRLSPELKEKLCLYAIKSERLDNRSLALIINQYNKPLIYNKYLLELHSDALVYDAQDLAAALNQHSSNLRDEWPAVLSFFTTPASNNIPSDRRYVYFRKTLVLLKTIPSLASDRTVAQTIYNRTCLDPLIDSYNHGPLLTMLNAILIEIHPDIDPAYIAPANQNNNNSHSLKSALKKWFLL